MADEIPFYDRHGERISMELWSSRLGTEYIRVARWERGDVVVSTVWLGLDHGFGLARGAPPIIFETMVFGTEMDESQWRYATEEQALEGHAHAVSLVKSLLDLRGEDLVDEPGSELVATVDAKSLEESDD